MPNTSGWKVELSTVGCMLTLYGLWKYLGWDSLFWYFGPYIIINAWLIVYTWLHHTHPNVAHYGSDVFTFLRGAISTIDRPYPALINELHHNIGSTHVAHHVNYSVPHYRAVQFTQELKDVLGSYYNYDPTPITVALIKTARTCHYIDELDGIQKYKTA
jgi:omega-6 fatty acid desaturase (delta-12 desaturase)